MAVRGVSEAEYVTFLSHGGELQFQIDARDIDESGGFESSDLIRPHLYSGFEIRPSGAISDPGDRALILLYGGSWTRVVAHAYSNGGRIIYRKLPDATFEARVSVPKR